MPLRQRAALKCQQFCWQWALLRPRGDQLLHDSPKKEASWKLRAAAAVSIPGGWCRVDGAALLERGGAAASEAWRRRRIRTAARVRYASRRGEDRGA